MQHLQKTRGGGPFSPNLESASRHSSQRPSPFFSHSCALFCTHAKFNSFLFNRFHTLYPKHPGEGVAKCHLLGGNSNQSLSEGRTELRPRPRTRAAHSAHRTASNSAKQEYATA